MDELEKVFDHPPNFILSLLTANQVSYGLYKDCVTSMVARFHEGIYHPCFVNNSNNWYYDYEWMIFNFKKKRNQRTLWSPYAKVRRNWGSWVWGVILIDVRQQELVSFHFCE